MSLRNYLTIHRGLKIGRNDLVIEIGPGGDPFLRSDIAIERFLDDDTERHSAFIQDRTTIGADGARLPFRDKSVDYVICSHVMEHIPDPETFLKEISRVGRRGLIVTPAPGYDKLHPKRGHLWYVSNENNILVFRQKHEWNEFPEIRDYFRGITRLPGYWKFWDSNYSAFNTMLQWNDHVEFRIDREGEFDMSRFIKVGDKGLIEKESNTPQQRAKALISKIMRPLVSANTSVNINELVCCPVCQGKLSNISVSTARTKCEGCGQSYAVKDGVPRLFL